MSGAQTHGLSFPLRSGETCALEGETLTVGQRQIPLRDIVSAGLVADLTIPTPPGLPPTPGVSLRLNDGSVVAFTPVEQLDCWRLLQALAAARPELAAPLPPPPGVYGPTTSYTGATMGYTPGYTGNQPGYMPPPGYAPRFGMAGPTESEKTLAGLCHLSVFFAPLILPLIIWLAMRRTQPYASQQAKQAFWFHLSFSVLGVIAFFSLEAYFFMTAFSAAQLGATPGPSNFDFSILPIVFALYGLLAVLGLVDAIFSVIAAVQTFQGKPFHYPLLGWLAR